MSLIFLFITLGLIGCSFSAGPVIINTWAFQNATGVAYRAITQFHGDAIDAVVAGCSSCERDQCDGTVGYGGSPNENGETTLDALIMDGKTMNVGAVAGMREIKDAIAVARHVLENTKHSILVGESATEFAVMMGFERESLSTDTSQDIYENWLKNNCQPNYWINVKPHPTESCGPYQPNSANSIVLLDNLRDFQFGTYNHDTIGMVVMDGQGGLAAGTSTNGARHKIPGRVGDSPIPGSGAYADAAVGGAAATGDGDVMLRFLPSFLAVEQLRTGATPDAAGEFALRRIAQKHKDFVAGIVVVNARGEYGAACHGMDDFPYSVQSRSGLFLKSVKCFTV